MDVGDVGPTAPKPMEILDFVREMGYVVRRPRFVEFVGSTSARLFIALSNNNR
jgi:hypothetical protein